MIPLRRRPITAVGLVPAVLVAALSAWRPTALFPLEQAAYDAVLRSTPTRPPSDRIVIVDVDERSLDAIGQWPWRRDRMGDLVSRARAAGAAVVALDIIFAEPDRYEGHAVQPDAALAEALAAGGVVLGYGMTFGYGDSGEGCLAHPFNVAIVGRTDHPPLFGATGAICSLPELVTAAGASGFLNAAPDADGRLRRAPLLIELDGRVYPALGLSAVSKITGVSEATLRASNAVSSALLLARESAPADSRAIPLDGQGNLLLRYRGRKNTFTYVSAVDVMEGRLPAGALRDKLVIVGTTALGTREVVSTPLDTLFTGVEVQATIADNLLQQDFLYRPEHAATLETIVALLLGIAAPQLVGRFGALWGAAGVAASAAGLWAGSAWVLWAAGAFLSPLYPSAALAGSLAAAVTAGMMVERRRAERAGRESQASRRLMVQTLLSLTEIKDAETGRHSRRTQAYTRVLAQELARHPAFAAYLTPERIDLLATLAPLHDIGKVGVPDRVLNKPGALTAEEMVEMRRHPIHGRDVIEKAQREAGVHDDLSLTIAKDIVYTHHERWDGSGYPEGLRGDQIPIPGRVMAVVDVYDAISTRRLYADPLSHESAVAFIVKGRGTHFDPDVVDAFLRVSPVLAQLGASAELDA